MKKIFKFYLLYNEKFFLTNVLSVLKYFNGTVTNFFLGICGGAMLAVRSPNNLCFYDWETIRMIRRIEIAPKQVGILIFATVL